MARFSTICRVVNNCYGLAIIITIVSAIAFGVPISSPITYTFMTFFVILNAILGELSTTATTSPLDNSHSKSRSQNMTGLEDYEAKVGMTQAGLAPHAALPATLEYSPSDIAANAAKPIHIPFPIFFPVVFLPLRAFTWTLFMIVDDSRFPDEPPSWWWMLTALEISISAAMALEAAHMWLGFIYEPPDVVEAVARHWRRILRWNALIMLCMWAYLCV